MKERMASEEGRAAYRERYKIEHKAQASFMIEKDIF